MIDWSLAEWDIYASMTKKQRELFDKYARGSYHANQ